jgi:hypothetical protein
VGTVDGAVACRSCRPSKTYGSWWWAPVFGRGRIYWWPRTQHQATGAPLPTRFTRRANSSSKIPCRRRFSGVLEYGSVGRLSVCCRDSLSSASAVSKHCYRACVTSEWFDCASAISLIQGGRVRASRCNWTGHRVSSRK